MPHSESSSDLSGTFAQQGMQGCGALPYASSIPEIPSALGALDAPGRAEFWASLALYHTRGMGGRTCRRLLETFGSAYKAIQQINEWGTAGVNEEKRRVFRTEAWRIHARKEWDAARGLRGTLLLWTDTRYPTLLRDLPDAPIRLYCQGDISLLSNPCVGIVGTRKCSRDGLRTTAGIAAGLASAGVTIVSGLAVGIDRQAHLAALDLPGGTIAVLGAGLDVDYPKQNADLRLKMSQQGLLLTEYAPGIRPDPTHFPVRNRIISGLSLGVLVVEAALRSGSLITARLALEQNRTVYAIPGLCGAREAGGCQELIREGAQPVFSSGDILADLLPQLRGKMRTSLPHPLPPPMIPSAPKVQRERNHQKTTSGVPRVAANKPQDVPRGVSPPEKIPSLPSEDDTSLSSRIVVLLAQGVPLRIDDVCHRLDAPPGEVSATLTILEVRGMVRSRVDSSYILA